MVQLQYTASRGNGGMVRNHRQEDFGCILRVVECELNYST